MCTNLGEPSEAGRGATRYQRPPPAPVRCWYVVAATTLNFNDVDGVRGRYRTVRPPLPYIPGMEVLGEVVGAGTGAEGWVGKRVVSIPSGAFGGYAELAVGPSAMAFEMPPENRVARTPRLRPSISRSTCRGWPCTNGPTSRRVRPFSFTPRQAGSARRPSSSPTWRAHASSRRPAPPPSSSCAGPWGRAGDQLPRRAISPRRCSRQRTAGVSTSRSTRSEER